MRFLVRTYHNTESRHHEKHLVKIISGQPELALALEGKQLCKMITELPATISYLTEEVLAQCWIYIYISDSKEALKSLLMHKEHTGKVLNGCMLEMVSADSLECLRCALIDNNALDPDLFDQEIFNNKLEACLDLFIFSVMINKMAAAEIIFDSYEYLREFSEKTQAERESHEADLVGRGELDGLRWFFDAGMFSATTMANYAAVTLLVQKGFNVRWRYGRKHLDKMRDFLDAMLTPATREHETMQYYDAAMTVRDKAFNFMLSIISNNLANTHGSWEFSDETYDLLSCIESFAATKGMTEEHVQNLRPISQFIADELVRTSSSKPELEALMRRAIADSSRALVTALKKSKTSDGGSALHYAVKCRDKNACIGWMLQDGYDPAMADDKGDTPVMLAARENPYYFSTIVEQSGSFETAQSLEELKTSLLKTEYENSETNFSTSMSRPISSACAYKKSTVFLLSFIDGKIKLLRLVSEEKLKQEVTHRRSSKLSAAFSACLYYINAYRKYISMENKTPKIISYDLGRQGQSCGRYYAEILQIAIKNVDRDTVIFLVENGIDVTWKYQDSDALACAGDLDRTNGLQEVNNDLEMIREFLARKLVEVSTSEGALEELIKRDISGSSRALVKSLKELKIQNHGSALHYAVKCPDKLDLISLMVEEGYDLTREDEKGSTPVALAAKLNSGYLMYFVDESRIFETINSLEGLKDSLQKENNTGATFIVDNKIKILKLKQVVEEFGALADSFEGVIKKHKTALLVLNNCMVKLKSCITSLDKLRKEKVDIDEIQHVKTRKARVNSQPYRSLVRKIAELDTEKKMLMPGVLTAKQTIKNSVADMESVLLCWVSFLEDNDTLLLAALCWDKSFEQPELGDNLKEKIIKWILTVGLSPISMQKVETEKSVGEFYRLIATATSCRADLVEASTIQVVPEAAEALKLSEDKLASLQNELAGARKHQKDPAKLLKKVEAQQLSTCEAEVKLIRLVAEADKAGQGPRLPSAVEVPTNLKQKKKYKPLHYLR